MHWDVLFKSDQSHARVRKNTVRIFVKKPKKKYAKQIIVQKHTFLRLFNTFFFCLKPVQIHVSMSRMRAGVGRFLEASCVDFLTFLCNFMKIYIVFECYLSFFFSCTVLGLFLTLLYAQCGRPATFSTWFLYFFPIVSMSLIFLMLFSFGLCQMFLFHFIYWLVNCFVIVSYLNVWTGND